MAFESIVGLYKATPVAGVDGQEIEIAVDSFGNIKTVGAGTPGSPSGGVQTTQLPQVAAAASTNVASLATNQTILAANAARQAVSIQNDDANALLIKYGATASATSYKVRIPGGGYWERPDGDRYTGIIDGIWEADGSGSARVTEQ